jgi:hypothetical protein
MDPQRGYLGSCQITDSLRDHYGPRADRRIRPALPVAQSHQLTLQRRRRCHARLARQHLLEERDQTSISKQIELNVFALSLRPH